MVKACSPSKQCAFDDSYLESWNLLLYQGQSYLPSIASSIWSNFPSPGSCLLYQLICALEISFTRASLDFCLVSPPFPKTKETPWECYPYPLFKDTHYVIIFTFFLSSLYVSSRKKTKKSDNSVRLIQILLVQWAHSFQLSLVSYCFISLEFGSVMAQMKINSEVSVQ